MIQTLSEQYFPRIFKSNGKVLLNAHMTNPFRDSESLAPLPPLLSADGLSKVTVPSHRLNNAPHKQNLPKQLFDLYLSQSQPFRVDLMCTVTVKYSCIRICMLDAGPVPGDPDPGNLPPDIRGQLAQEPHQHHQLPGTHHPSPPPPARPRY